MLRGVYEKYLKFFYGPVFVIWLYLQKTMYRPCDLDLWPMKVYFFQWIEYNPISILYKFQIDIYSNSREIKYQNIGQTQAVMWDICDSWPKMCGKYCTVRKHRRVVNIVDYMWVVNCFNVKMVLNRLDYGINKINRLYYINNALWIIQPGVEIPCFIFGLRLYIVQYTPWGTVAPLGPGVNYFYFARYYLAFARLAFAISRNIISLSRNNISYFVIEWIWWYSDVGPRWSPLGRWDPQIITSNHRFSTIYYIRPQSPQMQYLFLKWLLDERMKRVPVEDFGNKTPPHTHTHQPCNGERGLWPG